MKTFYNSYFQRPVLCLQQHSVFSIYQALQFYSYSQSEGFLKVSCIIHILNLHINTLFIKTYIWLIFSDKCLICMLHPSIFLNHLSLSEARVICIFKHFRKPKQQLSQCKYTKYSLAQFSTLSGFCCSSLLCSGMTNSLWWQMLPMMPTLDIPKAINLLSTCYMLLCFSICQYDSCHLQPQKLLFIKSYIDAIQALIQVSGNGQTCKAKPMRVHLVVVCGQVVSKCNAEMTQCGNTSATNITNAYTANTSDIVNVSSNK